MKKKSAEKLISLFHLTELIAFKLVLWLIVIGTLLAVARRAWFLNPSTLPLHYLLICIAGAVCLVLVLPNLLQRLRQVNFAGVTLTLGQLEQQQEQLNEIKIETNDPGAIQISENALPEQPDGVVSQQPLVPFSARRLSGPQLYQYERLSHQFYRIRDQIKNKRELGYEAKARYRDLIIHVAKAAWASGHYTKYLDVARELLALHEERDYAEALLLGHAYLWAVDENQNRRAEFLSEANGFLTEAVRKNPNNVMSVYNLGMCLFYQNGHRAGIKYMMQSVALMSSLSPWAFWNVAFAYKEMGNYDASLRILKSIDAGPVWLGIRQDQWFEPPMPDNLKVQFERLFEERTSKNQS